jgi:hypothetical protein
MPSSSVQWFFFTFYTLGAFGGWIVLIVMLSNKLRGRQ